jgi:hypothetical protein
VQCHVTTLTGQLKNSMMTAYNEGRPYILTVQLCHHAMHSNVTYFFHYLTPLAHRMATNVTGPFSICFQAVLS